MPVLVGKGRSLSYFRSFAGDPLAMTRALHDAHGPFVLLQYPWSRRSRPAIFPCIANAELYREVFATSDIWRGVKINFRGIKGHASDRLTMGMTRLRGPRHAHYRRLLAPPLSRPNVVAMDRGMAALADEEVSSWPRGVATDLLRLTEHLTQKLAIGLLFGADYERAMPIANMITKAGREPPLARAQFRLADGRRQAGTRHFGMGRGGAATSRNGHPLHHHNPDETGAPNPAIVGGLLSFAFGATYRPAITASRGCSS
jgi:cytochrome P450